MEDHVPRHAQMGAWVLINDRWYYKLMEQVELSIGAENVLNNFPDENPYPSVGAKYPESSPMGLAGGFYYVRVRHVF